jgi:hypothetical protein
MKRCCALLFAFLFMFSGQAVAAPKVPAGVAPPDPVRFPDIARGEGSDVKVVPSGPSTALTSPGLVSPLGATLQRYRVEIPTTGGYEPIRDYYQRFAIGNAYDPSGATTDGETFDVTYKSANNNYFAGFMYGSNTNTLGFPGPKGYQDCGWIAANVLDPGSGTPLSHGCPTTNSPVHGGNGLITFLPDSSYKYLDNGNCYPLDNCTAGSPVTTVCDSTAYSNVWPMRDGGPAPANGSVALDGMWVVPAGTTVGWRYVTKNKLWVMVNMTPPAGAPAHSPHWVFLYAPCVRPYTTTWP